MGNTMAASFTKALLAAVPALAMSLSLAPPASAWGEYDVVTPGSFLVSTARASNGMPYQCTTGFLVRSGNTPKAFTAGHCNRDPNNNTVLQRTPDGTRHIGHYTKREVSPLRDIGLVDLSRSSVPAVPDLDGSPVRGMMSAQDIRIQRPELCKSGARTGTSCGPVTDVSDTTVSFRAWDNLGDSGSPVYARRADGSVAAVAILYGHTDDEHGRIIHATLVEPVMKKWNLTLWD